MDVTYIPYTVDFLCSLVDKPDQLSFPIDDDVLKLAQAIRAKWASHGIPQADVRGLLARMGVE